MTKDQKESLYKKSTEELAHLAGTKGKYALDDIGKMATISTVLKLNLSHFFFVGFYRITGERMLQIGPYQGDLIACGTIPFDKGVCGACATKEETIIVPDVSQFPGYIACDDETKSEIVMPVKRGEELIAVLDVDGVEYDMFDDVDKQYLEEIVLNHFS